MQKFFLALCLILAAYKAQAKLCVCVENVSSYLNIRSCGSSSCSIQGTEESGACFEYIGTSGDWIAIQYGAITAYAHKNYLSDPCDTPCHCVTATSLNFRSCASSSCNILGTEDNGACFEHVSNSGSWRKMKYGSGTAYAYGNYLTDVESCSGGSSTCFGELCSGNPTNAIRGCDSQGCGYYGASRGGVPGAHKGADVKCNVGNTIYAPIPGTLTKSIPYGNGKCCDDGFKITGTGAWQGYVVKVWYNNPYSALIGQSVTQDQAVGTHTGLACCHGAGMTDHVHIQVWEGSPIINPEPLLDLVNCV